MIMKRILIYATALLSIIACNANGKTTIRGKVTLDGKALAGVLVSDGKEIVETNRFGRYAIASDKADSMVFITTPSGTVAESADGLRPGFWAMLEAAPDKVERHDFRLVSENQDNYRVLFLPDIHLSNDPRRNDIARFKEKVVPFIKEKASEAEGPVYMMNLGDFTHELYWYEFDFDEADACQLVIDEKLPLRTYAITGNHDHDAAIVGEEVDFRSAWLYRRVWGPDRYSVNIGGDHWVFLDNIIYINVEGQGKKAPGIKGDRSYEHALTDAQMEWLEKDLSYVPDEANVYICTHCPFYAGSYKNSGKNLMPNEQLERIDSLCSRFANGVANFSGHIHKFDYFSRKEYASIRQYGLPCSSGIMWETDPERSLYSSDGSEAGLVIGQCTKGSPIELSYHTYDHGERYYSIYDMNSVGKIYKNNPGVKIQRKLAPERADYSELKYRNCVFLNWWTWTPGCSVEMYEEGRPLEVKNVHHEDPVKNLTYDCPKLANPVKHHKARLKDSCIHMFEAKCRKADSAVEIVMRDAEGKIVFRETVQRPLAFEY